MRPGMVPTAEQRAQQGLPPPPPPPGFIVHMGDAAMPGAGPGPARRNDGADVQRIAEVTRHTCC
jgi:hypothetical protein